MFICFLSVYQGTPDEVDRQVKQPQSQFTFANLFRWFGCRSNQSHDCFSMVLQSVHKRKGYMIAISNDVVRDRGGLYARLWCVWEVHSAMEKDVPIVVHPLTGTESHLFGGTKDTFDPSAARCGPPGAPPTDDERQIRAFIDRAGASGWEHIRSQILHRSEYTVREECLDAKSGNIGPRGAELLLDVARTNTSLKILMLQNNHLGDRGAEVLAAALPHLRTLESLNLGANDIGDAGAQALAAALPQTTLETLFIDRNRISDVGAKVLAAALPHLRTLIMLRLDNNDIGDAGAQALAAALPQTTLKQLYIVGNRISDDGAKVLAAALPHLRTLETLVLSENVIGDAGAQALAAALPQTTLRELYIDGNRIKDDGAKALKAAGGDRCYVATYGQRQ
eukprot:NODE_586_length_1459_cov_432.082621.p1 GENE.NODE_586_length_1459_cov_432.082621~~NODE_586_length_1459_cov_432.082621.p1  ORF type:complete len:431 (-),score=111.40 NODE_586_length_1459_cov_432.082621:148-1329(-)